LSGAQKHGGLFLPVSHVEIHHGGQDLYPNSHQPPNDYCRGIPQQVPAEKSTQLNLPD
jgi:hypothetical protein